jgi:hypothetical protein
MAPLQQRYHDVLMARVRNDQFPSGQLLDRIEAELSTPEQITDYVSMLIDKVDETWFPSGQMLDRIERMLSLVVRA